MSKEILVQLWQKNLKKAKERLQDHLKRYSDCNGDCPFCKHLNQAIHNLEEKIENFKKGGKL